jgi:hypothetical protein
MDPIDLLTTRVWMFPIFCSVCVADGYDLPPLGSGTADEWDKHEWRSKAAVTMADGDAYCAQHWNERVKADS